jgi:hypothetical protein
VRPSSDFVVRAVGAYSEWAARFDVNRMSTSHEEVSEGLRRLSIALRALNENAPTAQDEGMRDRIASIGVAADER